MIRGAAEEERIESASSGRFGRRSLGVAVATAGATISALATALLTARYLGPQGRGEFALVTLLATALAIFFNLGLSAATVFLVASRRSVRSVIVGNNVAVSLVLGVIGMGVGFVLVGTEVIHGLPTGRIALALISLPFALLFTFSQSVLLGLEWFRAYNVTTLGLATLTAGGIAVSLVALNAGVTAAIAAWTVAWVLMGLVTLAWAVRAASGLSLRLDRSYLRTAGAYGIKAHLGNVLAFLGYRIDVFILNALAGVAAVGFYTVAVATVERLWLLSQSASTALLPRIASETDDAARKAFTPVVSRTVLWMTAVAATIVWAASEPLVTVLYSADFRPSVRPLQILLLGIVIFAPARVLGNDIAARGRPILNSYAAAVTLGVNVALNLILVPRLGIEGAAMASTASYALLSALTVALYCSLSNNTLSALLLPARTDLRLLRQALRSSVPLTDQAETSSGRPHRGPR